ncbi:MAG: TPM domain-containing protein [Erysipelotrichaceae bacterium]|nr:TPM domain-containing protein [Erysipelotrichaceae bacterium]
MKKIFILLLSLLLVGFTSFNVFANDVKVTDDPDYLSQAEEDELTRLCNEFIQYTGMDCVIYIAYQNSTDVTNLADDFYDYNGYGIGTDNEGIILCIDYGTREYTITTCGPKTIDTYTDYALDNYMYPDIGNCLSNGDTYGACTKFIEQALSVYRNYDYFHQPDAQPVVQEQTLLEKLTPVFSFGGIGAAISTMISYFTKRGQLRSTGEKQTARNYVTDARMNYARSGDIHLYTNVLRRRIERNHDNSHGGGGAPSSHSSVHISSSGVSHGGGGGHKF